ncbi:MAG: 4'-phosphopantetheinyl transferase superfamily protein [Flavobacterium sp.]
MIGNDIVDLALAREESNCNRKGFLYKLFTIQEQKLIKSSVNQENIIWDLWSRKEAAYKIYNRQTGIRKYNPIQFQCFNVDLEIGKVVFENQIFYTKTEITLEYIYTIAVSEVENFDKIKAIEKTSIIQKEKGIPQYINENKIIKPISKTHHGRFERIISII